MNFALLKKTQGLHAPLKLMMERNAASKVGRLPFLHSSNVMLEVLEGRDDEIGPEDVLNGKRLKQLSVNLLFIFSNHFRSHTA